MEDDLREKIRKFGEGAGDSSPPSSDGDRVSEVTIRWDMGKRKIKWGKTIAACILAAGSVAEVAVEIFSKDGVFSKLAGLFFR